MARDAPGTRLLQPHAVRAGQAGVPRLRPQNVNTF